MRHRPAAAPLHRQPGLGSVERLDLRLLVDRQHQRVFGRIDIEADNIPHLGGKLRVLRQLEASHPVRLETVRRRDPLHASVADPGSFRHRPAGPVRPLAGRLGQCHLDDSLDHRRRQRRLAGRAGGLMQQPVDALGHEARLPAPDRRFAFAGLPLDRHRADPGGTQQHDPSPPHMLLRTVPRPDHGFQPLTVARPKPDLDAFSHPARLACPRVGWNHSSASIH
jgi:hypothetical protein